MPRKAEGAFASWFRAQFGPRPSRKSHDDLTREYESAQLAANEALGVLEACCNYDDKMNAALYAWQATDEQKRVRAWEKRKGER